METLTTFDRLFAGAVPMIEHGRHQRDTPPVEGGRWPVSVVLRPDDATAERLERAMAEAEAFAGPGHFRTGLAGSVHFTVRALEFYRETVGAGDEAVRRYADAMGRAAREVGPIGLDLVGLTLTGGSVMACAHPVDESANRFMEVLRDELGEDGWHEAEFPRDIWYATVLHFATEIARPVELVEWVAERRDLDLGHTLIDTAKLVRFRYEDGADGRLLRPEVSATAHMAAARS